ncbi:MAG: hypothetical protein R6W75_10650, partial [Smithellaceae bacterium]
VIRMQYAPSDHAIDGLNIDFQDIISQGRVARIDPTPEECEEGADLQYPRIAFQFNKHDYGRLRQMIDVINSF